MTKLTFAFETRLDINALVSDFLHRIASALPDVSAKMRAVIYMVVRV